MSFFFFFQAEDGIRDVAVTGVQTCALPIFRAMAVPAAVVRDGGTISAVGAFVEMAAKCGGTTPLNGSQHLDMLPTKPVAISFDENLSRSADDIGHLQRRPAHLLLPGWLVVP